MYPAPCQPLPAASSKEQAAQRDMELVAAARAGSGAAFEELQKLYSRRLYQRIFSMTRNREDTEDALQETFLHAFKALATFEGRSQFASWLTRIAINSALMTLRKRRIRAEVFFGLPVEGDEHSYTFDVCDTACTPEQAYEQSEQYRYALREVSRLHPRLRTPLSIWMKEECSVKEVARTLDLPLTTVKARLQRARKRLNCNTACAKQVCHSGSQTLTNRRGRSLNQPKATMQRSA
jgi:RNA polymerase sigma-70 factor (ECF subfamily)